MKCEIRSVDSITLETQNKSLFYIVSYDDHIEIRKFKDLRKKCVNIETLGDKKYDKKGHPKRKVIEVGKSICLY